jgi:ureidoglycolate amidohydrolase
VTLQEQIDRLAEFNDDPAAGGITREVYTPTYAAALDWVADLMHDAGLTTRLDAFGNLWGRWTGADPAAPRVVTGSHVDTTLNAGKYDGVVGVLGAIAAVRTLRDSGFTPRRGIEVIAFAGEEPRFGTGCIGSRALVGALSPEDLQRLVDRNGISLAQALSSAGFPPENVPSAELDPTEVHAFVELHIEQGAVLETGGEQIGIVTAIAAPHDLRLTIRGEAAHSGATPMALRHDALAGAAEIMLVLERLAQASPSGTTVGTVGVLRTYPGAINVVPGEVQLDVDIRDSDLAARETVVAELLQAAESIATTRGLSIDVTPIVQDTPVQCAEAIITATTQAAQELELPHRTMTSGAYHDAMILAAKVPVGMIFIPSHRGISHHPDEYTEPAQIEAGAAVLAGTLRRLAS